MTTGSEMTPRSTQREVPEGRKSKLKMPRSERTGEVLLSVQSVKRYFRPKFLFLGIMTVRFPSSLPTIKTVTTIRYFGVSGGQTKKFA